MLQKDKEYALETMNEGVLIVSRTGKVLYVNKYAEEVLEIRESEDSVFKSILMNHRVNNDEIIDLITECLDADGQIKGKTIHYTNDEGRTFVLYSSCTKMEEEKYVFTFTDQTELAQETQKRVDSTAVLTSFFLIGCIWSVGVAVWVVTGEPFAVGYLTIVMEALGLIALGVLLKKTSFTIRDFGLSLENIGITMKRTVVRVIVMLLVFFAAKLVIQKIRPDKFAGIPFWDWSQADFRLIKYMITAFVQEFLARGGVQTALSRVFYGKHAKTTAIHMTSLYFAALHIQYGLPMIIGAAVLSILLGYIYKKDDNIYGVTIIHYCFGKFADFLHLI